MAHQADSSPPGTPAGFLLRLLRDRTGNSIAIITAAVFPLLGLAGGGIDMGRSYLSQSRLQQACDSSVLAARKKLGSRSIADGVVPADVAAIGNRFFDLNFASGSYGSQDRKFAMSLASDMSINGKATVTVPTTIMKIFGFNQIPIEVNCQGRLNFSNTDVMFVLDTTGSMDQTNPGDTLTKIEVLRSVVKTFFAKMEASKSAGTRIRYGFVPYSSNVNVGFLLKSDWVVDSWSYRGRVAMPSTQMETYSVYSETYTYISGTKTPITPYTATSCPADNSVTKTISLTTNADGSVKATYEITGNDYACALSADGTSYTVSGTSYSKYRYNYVTVKTGTAQRPVQKWKYGLIDQDVRFLKGATGDDVLHAGSVKVPMSGTPAAPTALTATFLGCMEERDTYEISDYSNVDLSRAHDLDIDLVPKKTDKGSQWRPMLQEISYEPEKLSTKSGTFNANPALTTSDFMRAWPSYTACPAAAQKLQEMTATQIANYLDTLKAAGNTYHDIGMIWGGRLLSPTGLFASENADAAGKATNRHLIFLTDGETMPNEFTYGTYGIEPLDQRRWSPSSALTQTQVIEQRFAFACQEVKKRNITVWVIGFGTTLNPVMTQCAGDGHSFEAGNATELEDVFSKIVAQMGELRITQ